MNGDDWGKNSRSGWENIAAEEFLSLGIVKAFDISLSEPLYGATSQKNFFRILSPILISVLNYLICWVYLFSSFSGQIIGW